MTLQDIPGRLPWTALESFVLHLGCDSALVGELSPEVAQWSSRWMTNCIIADLYDLVAAAKWENATMHTEKGKRKPRKPTPYPRPGAKEKKKIGKDPIPIRDFDDWWSGGDA